MPRSHEYSLLAGSSHPEFAKELSEELKKPLAKIELKTFSNGEQIVRIHESVRDKMAIVIQTCRAGFVDIDNAQTHLIADAAKQSDAKDVTVVMPFFAYARQDKIDKREPLSAALEARKLKVAGVDRLITYQFHSDQIQSVFGFPVYHLKTHDLFADYIKKMGLGNLEDVVVISTDAGGVKNAKALSSRLNSKLAIFHKERSEDNKAEITQLVGDVRGKIGVIVDDMIDTGDTIIKTKEALIKNGAIPDKIVVMAPHGIFSGNAISRFKEANFMRVVVTNTLPLGPEKQFPSLEQISVVPEIAQTIRKIVQGPSRT